MACSGFNNGLEFFGCGHHIKEVNEELLKSVTPKQLTALVSQLKDILLENQVVSVKVVFITCRCQILYSDTSHSAGTELLDNVKEQYISLINKWLGINIRIYDDTVKRPMVKIMNEMDDAKSVEDINKIDDKFCLSMP